MDLVPGTNVSLAAKEAHDKNTWRPLTYLALYRLTLATIFVVILLTGKSFTPLAQLAPGLYAVVSVVYFFVGLAAYVAVRRRRPAFDTQILLGVGIDILALVLIMHASGGAHSGLGILLVISVAGASIVTTGRTALTLASIAAVAVLAEHLYQVMEGHARAEGMIAAGLLGITLMASATLVHFLARRIMESEALARKRGIDLANMAELTEHIIQRMQTGILVIDPDDHVRLINDSAWYMLGMPVMGRQPALADVSTDLYQQLQRWRVESDYVPTAIQLSAVQAAIMPRFARITQDERPGVLIFLEDTSAMAQKAQQLKLASLGRLTGSIAHEIRNPLGAISHAGQLLAESTHLDEHDQRLLRIIADQSARVNGIVENVLRLSRRDRGDPQLFELREFLQSFISNYCRDHDLPESAFVVELQPENIVIRFDKLHLEQIMTNLCDNAFRHSREVNSSPQIELRGGIAEEFGRPFLDVIDHGPGLDADTLQKIFEPFFTTEAEGTGLGLYISRELAETNQAHINYLPGPTGGSCFRISFQDPRKHIG
ncbi:MAG TPA: ATPase [Gammaproteobacteria bacterium]|nr:ATPase [Gammaproteobacteria bacterium]